MSVDPTWLDGVLSRIDAAGGIEAYLAAHGVSAQQLAELRQAVLH